MSKDRHAPVGPGQGRRTWGAVATVVLALSGSTAPTRAFADIVNLYGGTWGNWPVAWTAVPSLNDPNDGAPGRLDFVGDASDPAAYWASDGTYFYVRMRVNTSTITTSTYADAMLVVIDVGGIGPANVPDYGFAWDSKSNDPTNHGMEMHKLGSAGSTWGATNMNDIDGSGSSKGINDINGNGRTGDGYIRAVTLEATTNLGTTSFLDFAVRWSYLNTYVGLTPSQTLRIGLASINNSNDHGSLGSGGDIAGGASSASALSVGWSAALTPGDGIQAASVPEPDDLILFGAGLGLLAIDERRKRLRAPAP